MKCSMFVHPDEDYSNELNLLSFSPISAWRHRRWSQMDMSRPSIVFSVSLSLHLSIHVTTDVRVKPTRVVRIACSHHCIVSRSVNSIRTLHLHSEHRHRSRTWTIPVIRHAIEHEKIRRPNTDQSINLIKNGDSSIHCDRCSSSLCEWTDFSSHAFVLVKFVQFVSLSLSARGRENFTIHRFVCMTRLLLSRNTFHTLRDEWSISLIITSLATVKSVHFTIPIQGCKSDYNRWSWCHQLVSLSLSLLPLSDSHLIFNKERTSIIEQRDWDRINGCNRRFWLIHAKSKGLHEGIWYKCLSKIER